MECTVTDWLRVTSGHMLGNTFAGESQAKVYLPWDRTNNSDNYAKAQLGESANLLGLLRVAQVR